MILDLQEFLQSIIILIVVTVHDQGCVIRGKGSICPLSPLTHTVLWEDLRKMCMEQKILLSS
jgi:hypothetical protein